MLGAETYNHFRSHPGKAVAKIIDPGRLSGRSGDSSRHVTMELATDAGKHYFYTMDQWEAAAAGWRMSQKAELTLEVGPLWTQVVSLRKL